MVFFVRITVNQSHLRPICKSTKFNPKIQRTIYLINFQQLRLHVPDFIRTVVMSELKLEYRNNIVYFNGLKINAYTAEGMRLISNLLKKGLYEIGKELENVSNSK